MNRADEFRKLHFAETPLLLANAWDAATARLIESCGAAAVATTSGGLAWSCGYRDGNVLPIDTLVARVEEIARVISVPLTVDLEGGYSADPERVAEVATAVVQAGAVGINLEDGYGSPDLLVQKIVAVKRVATRTGVNLFVNARTDVYLHELVPPSAALKVTLERGRQYMAAGCDGFFVPGVVDRREIGAITNAINLPLNVLIFKKLPSIAELAKLHVRRVSAGVWVAKAALSAARRAAVGLLSARRYDDMLEASVTYDEMNALFPPTP